MSTDPVPTRSAPGLTQTLAAFEQKLGEWLARAAEAPEGPNPEESDPDPFQTFAERLDHLQTYLDAAEAKADEALAPLSAEIQSLRQWLEALNLARGKLVERTAGAV